MLRRLSSHQNLSMSLALKPYPPQAASESGQNQTASALPSCLPPRGAACRSQRARRAGKKKGGPGDRTHPAIYRGLRAAATRAEVNGGASAVELDGVEADAEPARSRHARGDPRLSRRRILRRAANAVLDTDGRVQVEVQPAEVERHRKSGAADVDGLGLSRERNVGLSGRRRRNRDARNEVRLLFLVEDHDALLAQGVPGSGVGLRQVGRGRRAARAGERSFDVGLRVTPDLQVGTTAEVATVEEADREVG